MNDQAHIREQKNSPLRAVGRFGMLRLLQKGYESYEDTFKREIYLKRGTTPPAGLLDPSWAGVLAAKVISGALGQRAAPSLFSRLSGLGVTISSAASAEVSLPFLDGPVAGGWVGEGAVIRVAQYGAGNLKLTPRKMGVVSEFSYEMRRASIADLEGYIGGTMIDDLGAVADMTLLDDQPGSSLRPAGLRYGVVALSGSTDPATDIANLSKQMAGYRLPTLIMNQAQGIALDTRQIKLGWTILGSEFQPYGTITGLDASRLALYSGSAEADASDSATIHEESVTPLPLDALLASPIRSSFQTAVTALRVLWTLGWVISPTDVAVMTGADW